MIQVFKQQNQYFFLGYKILKIGVGAPISGNKRVLPKDTGSQECAPMEQELTHKLPKL